MSNKSKINNLLRNGNFAHREAYWNANATVPGRVDFSGQNCVITAMGSAEQAVAASGATSYTFSLYTLATYNGAGSASLTFEPSGTTESIPLVGNHAWTLRSITFNTPAGTTRITVRLTATAGDVKFDSVRLVEDGGSVIPIELIRNGDFAADSDEWSTHVPVGATVTFHNNQSQLNLGGSLEQDIIVTPGQTYNFFIDASTPSGGHGFVIFHLTPTNSLQIELRGSGGWDTYPFSFAVPPGVTVLTLQVVGTTFLVIDNLSLKSA